MKVTIKIEKEVDLKTMHVSASVRCWEDGTVNEEVDTDGTLIPCRKGDLWEPIIELETGRIRNWEQGKKGSVHYKVCDQCSFHFEDAEGNKYLEQEQDYVPDILCPADNGYGDYIIMEIDENGTIQDWGADLGSILKNRG